MDKKEMMYTCNYENFIKSIDSMGDQLASFAIKNKDGALIKPTPKAIANALGCYISESFIDVFAVPKSFSSKNEFTRVVKMFPTSSYKYEISLQSYRLPERPKDLVSGFKTRFAYYKALTEVPAYELSTGEWLHCDAADMIEMDELIKQMYGKVLIIGLNIGYEAFMAARKADITAITIVEPNAEKVAVFKNNVLTQLDDDQAAKITFATESAIEDKYDFVYVHMWQSDADVEVYLRYLAMLNDYKATVIHWMEDAMLLRYYRIIHSAYTLHNILGFPLSTNSNQLEAELAANCEELYSADKKRIKDFIAKELQNV